MTTSHTHSHRFLSFLSHQVKLHLLVDPCICSFLSPHVAPSLQRRSEHRSSGRALIKTASLWVSGRISLRSLETRRSTGCCPSSPGKGDTCRIDHRRWRGLCSADAHTGSKPSIDSVSCLYILWLNLRHSTAELV